MWVCGVYVSVCGVCVCVQLVICLSYIHIHTTHTHVKYSLTFQKMQPGKYWSEYGQWPSLKPYTGLLIRVNSVLGKNIP